MSSRNFSLLLVILLFMRPRVASEDSVVQHPDTTKVKDGGTVVLLCSAEDKKDISPDLIQWFKGPKRTENKPIHVYNPRNNPPQTQRDDFNKRTSLDVAKLATGDCSLSLEVKPSDSDTYYCYVAGNLSCTVTLKVLPEEEDSSQRHQGVNATDKPKNGKDGLTQNYWTIGVGIAASLITLVVYF